MRIHDLPPTAIQPGGRSCKLPQARRCLAALVAAGAATFVGGALCPADAGSTVAAQRAGSQPAGGAAATMSAAAAAETQVDPRAVEALIARLGDADFDRRELAATELKRLGDAALDVMLKHLNDPDREVVARIESIIAAPPDAPHCLRTALVLFDTGRAALIEKGVDMLFLHGAELLEPFRRAAAAASGNLAIIAPSILEELEMWVKHEAVTLPRMAGLSAQKRAKQMQLMEEMRRGRAQAAYLLAVADLAERRGSAARGAANQP